jgi:dimethylhistidine N-methyltransferase
MARGSASRVSYHDLGPDTGDFKRDVIAGLSRAQKTLSPKYFYDERGSELFEAICELPEYYPTRTEIALMRDKARDMARLLGPRCVLIEYGSGSGRKTRILVEALAPAAYVPIDIAAAQLGGLSSELARDFPEVAVIAVCADYSRPLAVPGIDRFRRNRRVIYFPGSTIGNFTVPEAISFLRNARSVGRPGGAMLVGVDLKKDPRTLHAAYDDAQGVTAEFNLNLLARIKRELGADIDTRAFRHRAFYNEELGRIEMHLESLRDQQAVIANRTFVFRRGETIHTENSYKYAVGEFQDLARSAGFEPQAVWTDEEKLFSVHYLTVPA